MTNKKDEDKLVSGTATTLTTTKSETKAVTIATQIKVLKLDPAAILPSKKSATAACFDLFANASVSIGPGATALIPTVLAFELPEDYEAQVRPRSGLALNHGVTVLNTPGTIDSDYRGEVGVILYNTSATKSFKVEPGDRIAQVGFHQVPTVVLSEVKKLSTTDRGEGGFGSTGK